MPVMWCDLPPDSFAQVGGVGVLVSDNFASPTSATATTKGRRTGRLVPSHDIGSSRTDRHVHLDVPPHAVERVRSLRPDVMLGLGDIAAEHRYGGPAARAHDRHRIATTADQILRRAHPHRMSTEAAYHLGRQTRLLGRAPDQALHRDIMQGARQRTLMVDRTKQRLDPRPAPGQLSADQIGCGPGTDHHATPSEGIGVAASDHHAQPAMLPPCHILHAQRHQFGAPQQQLAAEHEHLPVAQTPGGVGLHRQEGLEMALRHPLSLARPRALAAQHSAQSEPIDLGRHGIGRFEQGMRCAECGQAPAQGCRRQMSRPIVEEAANHRGRRREWRDLTLRAPGAENGRIAPVALQSARGIGPLEPRPEGVPIRRHPARLSPRQDEQLAVGRYPVNRARPTDHVPGSRTPQHPPHSAAPPRAHRVTAAAPDIGASPRMTAPMHILMTVNAAWNILNFRQPLLDAFVEDGHRVTVLAPPDDSVPQLEQRGLRCIPLSMDIKGLNPWRDYQLIGRLQRHFREEKPDVVLSFTIKNNIFGAIAAKRAGVPFIPNITGLGTAFLSTGPVRIIAELLYRRAFRGLEQVFFQNGDDRDLFISRALVHARQAQLLPGSGIDLRHFTPSPLLPAHQPPVFLKIGRLLRDKGTLEFVAAAREVRRHYPEVRFQLLGAIGAENRTAISADQVATWQADGIIEYLGHTADVRPVIAQATCVVLPSYREGAPRTLMEAAAMARPLIATDVPGCRSVVEHGINGFLCDVRSAESLAEACLRMLALSPEQRRVLGAAGRRKMEREFDQAHIVTAYRRAVAAAVASRVLEHGAGRSGDPTTWGRAATSAAQLRGAGE